MNKKTILRIVLIIIAIILVLVIIHTVRNYIILEDLSIKMQKIYPSGNYSYIIEDNEYSEGYHVIKRYYKDGISLSEESIEGEKTSVNWKDENNNETIQIDYKNGTAKVVTDYSNPLGYNKGSGSLEMLTIGKVTIWQALRARIYEAEVDGKECYILGDFIFYKEDGTYAKTMVKSNTYLKEWKFNEVTDEDVAKPDLTGLEVITHGIY